LNNFFILSQYAELLFISLIANFCSFLKSDTVLILSLSGFGTGIFNQGNNLSSGILEKLNHHMPLDTSFK